MSNWIFKKKLNEFKSRLNTWKYNWYELSKTQIRAKREQINKKVAIIRILDW